MADPDNEQWKSLLHGPPEIPISPEHRLHLRSRVLEAYDSAGRSAAKSRPAMIRLLLTRALAAAACVALGLAIGWFVRGPVAPPFPSTPGPGLAAGGSIDASPMSAGRSGDFWSYRRLARLHVSNSAAVGSDVQPRSPRNSMWDLPVKGD